MGHDQAAGVIAAAGTIAMPVWLTVILAVAGALTALANFGTAIENFRATWRRAHQAAKARLAR